MHINNEIGTMQPVEEIGKICEKKKVRVAIEGLYKGLGTAVVRFVARVLWWLSQVIDLFLRGLRVSQGQGLQVLS